MFKFFASRIIGTARTNDKTPPKEVLPFYWHYLQQHWPWYLGLFTTMMFVALLDLAVPISIGYVTALLESEQPRQLLSTQWPLYLSLLTLVLLVRPIFQMLDLGIRLNIAVPGTTALIRWQTHWHVVRQSWPFFQNDFAGRIANRIMQTGNAIRESMLSTLRAGMYICVYGTSALVVMSWSDWRLAVPMAIWAVGYVGFLKLFIPRLLSLSKKASETRSNVVARVVDSYTNILTVKLFSRAIDEDNYVREAMDANQEAVSAHTRNLSWFLSALQIMNALLLTSTTIVGLFLWLKGDISAAVVATAVPLVWQITNISGWISFEVAGIFESIGVVQEGMQSISVPHKIVDDKQARALDVKNGHIEFKSVDFSYKESQQILTNFSLAIQPGERIGVVGRSGAGKSTLINILLRFFDIEKGCILIDDQNISEVTQESLRLSIGLVTQDTSLLHRSIADNIRYGCPNASMEQVTSAAKKAHADHFIQGLEDWKGRKGYEAHTGERGVKLSGGQRQRIALARVILKNAPILILDEATSALDSEIEIAIQEQLNTLMENKTVIAIAHRLSTIARMDRLIVIDEGRIVEQGSHTELLEKNGLYAGLWNHQSGGFLAETLPAVDATETKLEEV